MAPVVPPSFESSMRAVRERVDAIARYRCYVCRRPVTTTDAESTLDAMAADSDLFDRVTERYSLVHCEGDDDQFTADGAVVVCPPCVAMCTAYIRVDGALVGIPSGDYLCPIRGCRRRLRYTGDRHQRGIDGDVAAVYTCRTHGTFTVPQTDTGLRAPTRNHWSARA